MIDVRQTIVDLITPALSVPVLSSHIDPLKQGNYVLVKNSSKTFDLIDHARLYRVNADIDITVFVAQTTGFEAQLDSLVASVVDTLLTNPDWLSQFEEVGQIKFDYVYDVGGETNLAVAKMSVEVQYVEQYEPTIQDNLTTIHLDVDAIDPVDTNVVPVGPDGIIEVQLDIDIPQE